MNDLQWRTIEELKGHVLTSVEVVDDGQELHFYREDGAKVVMYHEQDCCEEVALEDIDGDLVDLVGLPILEADEASREAEDGELDEEGTWTYYKLGTSKGSVSFRWLGESNGYYSESVDIRVE